jgi:TorA maturation chaperone TorD
MKDSKTNLELAYRFLATVFHESPAAAFMSSLVAQGLIAEWPLSAATKETQTGLRLMEAFCAAWIESMLPDLEADFNRLFVGPGRPLAPPWESYYLSRDHLLFQAQTLAVRKVYRQFGLEVPRIEHEPDDSLGLELYFMAVLCGRRSSALNAGQGAAQSEILLAQREFLVSHVLAWVPQCLGQVIENARFDYYRGAACLGLGCLIETGAALGLDVSTPCVDAARRPRERQ